MRRIFSFLSGILSGVLVGGVAALLMAPTSGDELRGTASDRLEAFLDEIRRAAAERRGELEAELEALKRGDIPPA